MNAWGRGMALWCIAAVSATLWAAPKTPKPIVRVPLKSLGYLTVSQNFMDTGATMLTVHFADGNHALVTYSSRGLVERVPGDPVDDQDRIVTALLVELPGGKVVARTQWHLHDHGQYLWTLGSGRFLLRVRGTLTAIAPMANWMNGAGDPFRQTPFFRATGQLDGVQVSAEGDLVTVQTSIPRKKRPDLPPGASPAAVIAAAEAEPKTRPPELFTFLRVSGEGSAEKPVQATVAGVVRGMKPGLLPMDGRGYLIARSKGKGGWSIEFEGFDGETKALSDLNSSCTPSLRFVAPGQYAAFTCRGTEDRTMISAFDFAPHEMWEELLGDPSAFAYFAYSPETGRFVLSRVRSLSPVPLDGGPAIQSSVSQEQLTGQEVRVYQTQSGDLLLQLESSPVLRTGQNFDLSADGMSLMVVRNDVLEVYALPPLTKADKKELAEVRAFAPASAESKQVVLRRLVKQDNAATEAEAPLEEKAKPAAAAPDVEPKSEQPSEKKLENGDSSGPRKPPSLMNPREKPQ